MTLTSSPVTDYRMTQYSAAKPPGDIDLVHEVRQLLVQAGLGDKLATCFDGHVYVLKAAGRLSSVQQYYMNRYWSLQLAFAQRPSIDERYCLVPNGTPQAWLELFRVKVLPFVLDNGLPLATKGP